MHRAPGTPGAGRAWGPGSKSRHAGEGSPPAPPAPAPRGRLKPPLGTQAAAPARPGTTSPGPVTGRGSGPGEVEWAQGSHASVRLPRLTVRFKGRVYRAIAGKKDGVPGTRSEAAAAARGKLG